jgi:hypothetical protein
VHPPSSKTQPSAEGYTVHVRPGEAFHVRFWDFPEHDRLRRAD